jgi:hypothetical protein
MRLSFSGLDRFLFSITWTTRSFDLPLVSRTVELCRHVGDEGALAAVLWQAWLFNYTRADHTGALNRM